MLQMPEGASLVKEMTNALPLFCYSNKRNTKALAAQGIRLNEKTRLEIIGVRDFFDAGGIMCDIRHTESGQVLVMSITGLDFADNGAIDEKISEYKKARIEWLKQEERRDLTQGLDERIKIFNASPSISSQKISRNAPCSCGSGKKYKHCCAR